MSSKIYQADKYAKLNLTQRSEAFEYIVKNYDFLSSMPFPVKVLDVGCGTGENTKLFTYFKNVTEIEAFDVGADMIEYAKRTTFDSRVKFYVANVQDFETWPNPKEGYFDFVISLFVLHWVPDNKSALKNIYRSLRPGGYFMARILGKRLQHDKDLYEFIKCSPKWSKYAQENHEMLNHSWMDEDDPSLAYRNLMATIGFEKISAKNVEIERYGNREETKEYIQMSRLRHFNIPEEQFDEFVEECTDAFMKATQVNEAGQIKWLPTVIIDVLAQKPYE